MNYKKLSYAMILKIKLNNRTEFDLKINYFQFYLLNAKYCIFMFKRNRELAVTTIISLRIFIFNTKRNGICLLGNRAQNSKHITKRGNHKGSKVPRKTKGSLRKSLNMRKAVRRQARALLCAVQSVSF